MPADCKLCGIVKMCVYDTYFRNEKITLLKECPECKRPVVMSQLHRMEFQADDIELIKFLHGEFLKDYDIDYDMSENLGHVHYHFNKRLT